MFVFYISERLDNSRTRLVDAFLYKFANARGRLGICGLLNLLCKPQEHISATNIGGGSKLEPGARLINFEFNIKADSSSSDSSPEKSKDKSSQSSNPPTIIDKNYHSKLFVPDVLLEKIHSFPKQDLMVVSINSDIVIGYSDKLQLRYELLPLVVEHRTAFGLLISSGSAVVTKLKVNDDNDLEIYEKYYDFEKPEWKETFIDMCQECVYNISMLRAI